MKTVIRTIPLALLMSLGNLPAQAEYDSSPLATMMWTMADIMGVIRDNNTQSSLMPMAGAAPMMSPMSGMSPLQAAPFLGMGMNSYGSQIDQALNQFRPNAGQSPGHWLNGYWRGVSGELLFVRGKQFRLQADRQRGMQGEIIHSGDRLILHIPSSGVTQSYEFIRNSQILILRSNNGQTLTFKRMPKHPVRVPTTRPAGYR